MRAKDLLAGVLRGDAERRNCFQGVVRSVSCLQAGARSMGHGWGRAAVPPVLGSLAARRTPLCVVLRLAVGLGAWLSDGEGLAGVLRGQRGMVREPPAASMPGRS